MLHISYTDTFLYLEIKNILYMKPVYIIHNYFVEIYFKYII